MPVIRKQPKIKTVIVDIDEDFHTELFLKARQHKTQVSKLVRRFLREWLDGPLQNSPQTTEAQKEELVS